MSSRLDDYLALGVRMGCVARWVGEKTDWPGGVPSLNGCWTKYERALEHIDTLTDEIESYPKSFAVERGFERGEGGTGTFYLRVAELPEIPRRWSAIVGDAVHNLRSVLDHLAWQLGLLNLEHRGKPSEKTAFVIANGPKKFEKEAKTRLASLHPDHVHHLESLQPYHGSQVYDVWSVSTYLKPLAWLRDLSNIDKHKVLHGTYLAQDFSWDTSIVATGEFEKYTPYFWATPWPLEVGIDLVRIECEGVTDDTWFDIAYPMQPRIVFEQGLDVRETLEKIRLAVGRVLQEFEPIFRRAGDHHWTLPLDSLVVAEQKRITSAHEPEVEVFRI